MERPEFKPPRCPNCHQPPWRDGRGVKQVYEGDIEGEFVLCMHCISIWKLDRSGRRPKWVRPTEKELATMAPIFAPAAERFYIQRMMLAFPAGEA